MGGEFLPRNKYPEETVQKILDASLKLFLEKGYEETTVLDIISEMGGLTRGAFYHHEELFIIISNQRKKYLTLYVKNFFMRVIPLRKQKATKN